MKKIFILAILICLVSAFAFASDFTVQTVTGRVEGAGKALKAGDTITGDTVVRTNVGASLVLVDSEGKVSTIPAGRNGKVEELVKAASGSKIGGNVVRTNTGSAGAQTRQTSTASARASDQAGNNDIAAE